MFVDTEEPRVIAICEAIHKGDTSSLKALLQEHPDLTTAYLGSPDEARTLLHVLTDWPGNYPNGAKTTQILAEAGAKVDAPFIGKHSETALHWAASCDDVAVLDALLDAGANINAGGGVIAETPLADARAFLQMKAAHRLVERGADATLQDVATLGLLDKVKGFYGESLEGRPDEQDTNFALWNASHGGQIEVVQFLYGQGADVNTVPPWENLTPVDAARRSEAGDVVEWLETKGGRRFEGE
ncbi:hypothetical protein QQS21_010997 [Conoideocrella luteorostrata]|uniref:Ankyrin repeat-containing protein n=1 Tax=Conoideocrella luteorostrata TaxID=1105319 RepID=A0AAJ0FU54_9HYPO|nr:hypothetical protein QQS21_010997 [Conoideocrella luteorostrata]